MQPIFDEILIRRQCSKQIKDIVTSICTDIPLDKGNEWKVCLGNSVSCAISIRCELRVENV